MSSGASRSGQAQVSALFRMIGAVVVLWSLLPIGLFVWEKIEVYPKLNAKHRLSEALSAFGAARKGLEDYRTTHSSYPDAWYQDLYVNSEPDLGPPMLNQDIQAAKHRSQSRVEYRYSPLPHGCVEPSCAGYLMTAVSVAWYHRKTASYSVLMDGTELLMCEGDVGADASHPEIKALFNRLRCNRIPTK